MCHYSLCSLHSLDVNVRYKGVNMYTWWLPWLIMILSAHCRYWGYYINAFPFDLLLFLDLSRDHNENIVIVGKFCVICFVSFSTVRGGNSWLFHCRTCFENLRAGGLRGIAIYKLTKKGNTGKLIEGQGFIQAQSYYR